LHLKRLDKAGLRGHAGMLRCVVGAACWTPARKYDAGLRATPSCPLCGAPRADIHHQTWECPEIAKRAEPTELAILEASDHLKEQAATAKQLGEHTCFWQRGLPPRDWYLQDEAWTEDFVMGAGDANRADIEIPLRPLFLDGSGSSSDPRLRRCGWAVAWHEQGVTTTTPPNRLEGRRLLLLPYLRAGHGAAC